MAGTSVRVVSGGYVLDVDAQATAAAHAARTTSAAEDCGCEPCLAYATARATIQPPVLVDLLASLGIPVDGESEVHELGHIADDHTLFGGWFHCVGALVQSPPQQGGNAPTVTLSPAVSISVSDKAALVPKPLAGLQLLQLDFSLHVPNEPLRAAGWDPAHR